MAKSSMVARENKRIKLTKKYAAKRAQLRSTIKTSDDYASIDEAVVKLQKLPVNSGVTRQVNRCNQCGRPHGVYKKFKLCRICLRNHLMLGNIPGGKKASW